MSYYNEISEGYEELHREEQENKLKLIKKELSPIAQDTRLLDVGCGTGVTSQFECIIYGADPAIKLLEKAKNKQKPDFLICAEAENLPFKDGSFDMVISVTAIQNFHDINKGLDEMKRVAKPEAIFALSFLKRSEKKETITKSIKKRFKAEKFLEEDKDLIFFCKKL